MHQNIFRNLFGCVCISSHQKWVFLAVLIIVFLSSVGYGADADWTAYNDCVGSTISNPSTTEFTDYYNYAGNSSGLLKNDATGSTASMPTVTFTIPTDPAIQPNLAYDYGVNPDPGTEAYEIFNGKVDFSGTIIQHSDDPGWFVEIEFLNLDPSKKYTFVGSAFRNSEYTDRETQHVIRGADSFVNNSSDGVVYKDGDTTILNAGDNSNEGYVVRWDDIKCGSDRAFSIYTVSVSSWDGKRGYPLHGFMLMQLADGGNNSPVVDAGANDTTTLPRQYVALNGSVSDDGQGEPMGFLESTWSQISGPAAEFVTDVNQPDVTVHCPVAGVYEFQLDATDGLLNATPDTATVTVYNPVCPIGDVDGDCMVTLSDLELIGQNWLDNTGTSDADLDGDTWVKTQDLSILGQSWQEDWTGSLQVTILPSEVVSLGAQWRVDGGEWCSSSETVYSLSEGQHSVEFSNVEDWTAPENQLVTITRQQATQASGIYSDMTGSLQVTILPTEVLAFGTRWRVDSSEWKSSGDTVSFLLKGQHNVEFSDVDGWVTPENQSVTITAQQTTQTSGTYIEIVQTPQTIVISEFMAINSYIPYTNPMNIYTRYPWNTGSSGNVYPDWIELHNNGNESIDLAGWYLTDNPDNLTKWQFPSDIGSTLILDPDEYIIVFASNKEQVTFPANYPFVDYYGALHTNFELGANGEYLAVIAPDGVTVCHAYENYPEQVPFTSYGIASDQTIGYMTTPTPGTQSSGIWLGAANMSTALPGRVDDTKFSHSRGFFENPFNVSISCSTLGAEIHYTVDGTEPQATVGGNTILYSSPITISTTTCLRVKAFKSGLIPSNIDTQTYLFLDDVVTQTRPSDSRYSIIWDVTYDTDYGDYDMENNTTDIKLVAGNAGYTVEQAKDVIKNALLEIPTLSVVSDPAGIFGSAEGIYTHTLSSGLLWERAGSAEYFNGDPNDAFQVDCGFRIQGGNSRKPHNAPKHSFSLRFRGGYGSSKLKSNILDHQSSVEEFDSFHLRAGYNNSWFSNYDEQRERSTLIRDQFARDCIVAMGQTDGGSGTYVHLYINGLYWGVFNMHERPDASHCANYFGGDSEWYDAIKAGEMVDGTGTSWDNLKTLVRGASSSSQTDWEAICAKLDINNVIDWSIIQCWGFNHDMRSTSNWAAAGGGIFDAPWRYYLWDVERVFEEDSVGDPTVESIFGTGGNFLTGSLNDFAEFRIRFADRVYKHFYNNGVLTAISAQAIFNRRVTELGDAFIAESARWGDYRRDFYKSPWHQEPTYLYTKNDFWLPATVDIKGWLQQKESNAISFFRDRGLYPSIEPPVFVINSIEQSGGYVTMPCTFDMENNNGTGDVYYTLDGTDPREYWTGNVSGTAVLFNGTPITLDKSTIVKARVKSGSTWSALHEAVYVDNQICNSIRITEIMYNPADLNTEFIELKNIGTSATNLNLVRFNNGIDFTFGDITVPADGYVVAVQNTAAFTARYPSFSGVIAGQYTGSLDNGSEKVELVDGSGTIIHQFNYKDGWYDLTDGFGFSLTIRDPLGSLSLWDQKIGWRSSVYEGGTPGEAAVSVLVPGSIVINEVLAHSHATNPDWIELHNTTGNTINISGWFLSDNNDDDPNLMKYEIQSTSIPAYGYVYFVENVTFGNPLAVGCHTPFGLSEAGETVYLHSGAGGQITGYYQTEENFDATETGVTIGRYEKAELSGGYDFARMSSPSQGSENSNPLIPDVVITEIHYNPPEGTDYEFVELYNHTGSAVTLMSDATTETSPGVFVTESIAWRLEGTGYEFPTNTVIPAYSYIIVAKDPTLAIYSGLSVYGPYDGKLDNGGEQIEIQIPGDQEFGQSRYWIPIEKIDYDDAAPWPTSPDGNGDSLRRISVNMYGRDYSNWQAVSPDPGL